MKGNNLKYFLWIFYQGATQDAEICRQYGNLVIDKKLVLNEPRNYFATLRNIGLFVWPFLQDVQMCIKLL